MNEIRQKFEEWAKARALRLDRLTVRPDWYRQLSTQDMWGSWRAAYEAGEIAMQEKAANRAAEFYLAKGDALDIARAIRALAISGAEESKKEKA